jgi:hypothetical protein
MIVKFHSIYRRSSVPVAECFEPSESSFPTVFPESLKHSRNTLQYSQSSLSPNKSSLAVAPNTRSRLHLLIQLNIHYPLRHDTTQSNSISRPHLHLKHIPTLILIRGLTTAHSLHSNATSSSGVGGRRASDPGDVQFGERMACFLQHHRGTQSYSCSVELQAVRLFICLAV